MACGACMTHTNPEPCCPETHSSFGNLSGFSLFESESPPWIRTVIGVAVAAVGVRRRDVEPDLAVPLILGGLMVPALSWIMYASRSESASEYGAEPTAGGEDDNKKKKAPKAGGTDDNKKKKLSTVIWKGGYNQELQTRNFGALALQSNPAHYSGVLTSRGVLLRHGSEDETQQTNENEARHRRTGGSGGVARAGTGGSGVIIRSDGTVINLNGLGYGSPDADDVKKGLASVGAAGFGIMGALAGAAVGTVIQVGGKPLKNGGMYGAIAGFMLPVLLLSPKSEEAA